MDRVDMRSSITCLAILQIEAIMQKLPPGDCIEVLCDDETLVEELRRIRNDFSYEQMHCKTQGDQAGMAFILRKQKQLVKEFTMSDIDLSSVQVSSTADARGSACPGPLLEAKKGIGKVKVGEVLEIYSNDSGTRTDIPAWAKKVGHEYMGMLSADGYDKHFVRRKK